MPCVQEVPQRLAEERRAQAAHVARVRGALERGKGAWFLPGAPVAELMQHCVLPRLLLSPGDAQYAARLLLLAHDLGAPHLSTLLCLDHVRAPSRPLSRRGRLLPRARPHGTRCLVGKAACRAADDVAPARPLAPSLGWARGCRNRVPVRQKRSEAQQ